MMAAPEHSSTKGARVTALETSIGSLPLLNPIICSSGEHVMTASGIRAALRAGAAAVVAKSVNETEAAAAQLDIADYVALDRSLAVQSWNGGDPLNDSLFFRSGLAQRKPEDWYRELGDLDREAATSGRYVIASIVFARLEGALPIAHLAARNGIRIFEFNVGSPQSLEAKAGTIVIEGDADRLREQVRQVRAVFPGQLWVKLPGIGGNIVELARAAFEGGADAVGMTGRFMGLVPDIETFGVVLGTAGGYGGPWALPMTCRWLAMARKQIGRDAPLVGTNGARTGLDVVRFLLSGASAVELASVIFQGGFDRITAMLAEVEEYLARKDVTVKDLIGRSADSMAVYDAVPPRPGAWRDFVPAGTLDS